MAVIYLVLAVVFIILLTARLKLHPFLALFAVALVYGFASGMSYERILESVYSGFGDTIGRIGLIIVFGVIIGIFLEKSGGALRLAEGILSVIGRKRVPTAMGMVGYFISIPVFADSGFILLSALNRTLASKAGISLAVTSIALALGLMATHTMVPPTPGPIAAAGILDANLGLVMLIGLPVSAFSAFICIQFAKRFGSRVHIEPELETIGNTPVDLALKTPGLLKSSLPVIVPIFLIVTRSIIISLVPDLNDTQKLIAFLGEPVIALLIGVILSMFLPAGFDKSMLSTSGWVGTALKDAATIILVTGAGGIFGKMLQNSGIAESLGSTLGELHLGIWLPFILAAAIKSAQGSSTVALITAASIILPLMDSLGFTNELQKAMVVLAIGAGSAVFSHANDSFFWVVTQMSGMDVKTGYRLLSTGSAVLGFAAIFILYLLYTTLT